METPKENVTWKYKFASIVLLQNFSNSFNLYNVTELSRNRTAENCVQVETENDLNLPSRVHVLHKTLNLVISRCYFAQYGEEIHQNL